MVTIKELAKELNISYEAVRQQVKRYGNSELKGHISHVGKVQYLDEYAVDFIRSKRESSPVIWQQQDMNEIIEQLTNENKNLLIKVAAQADKIAELSDWKAEQAIAIAAAEHQKLLVETTQEENDKLKANLTTEKERADKLQRELDEANKPISFKEWWSRRK